MTLVINVVAAYLHSPIGVAIASRYVTLGAAEVVFCISQPTNLVNRVSFQTRYGVVVRTLTTARRVAAGDRVTVAIDDGIWESIRAIIAAATPVPAVNKVDYPHTCPRCKAPAYIRGNNTVDCSAGC